MQPDDATRASRVRCSSPRRTSRSGTTGSGSPQHASARDAGWHRTGDVGHLDADGRLWIEGRLAHVLVTADGRPSRPSGWSSGRRRSTGVRVRGRGRRRPARHAAGRRRRRSPRCSRTARSSRSPGLAAAVRAALGRHRRRRGARRASSCRRTSGTTRRSTGPASRRGPSGCWRGSGRGCDPRPGHRRERDARAGGRRAARRRRARRPHPAAQPVARRRRARRARGR